MNKINKIFLLTLLMSSFSLSACSGTNSDSSSADSSEDSTDSSIDSINQDIYAIYEIYRSNGGALSYEEWLESIKGEKGDKGDKGDTGETGANGLSAYELYLKHHEYYGGSEKEWTDDLANGDLGRTISITVDKLDGNTEQIVEVPFRSRISILGNPTLEGFDLLRWDCNDGEYSRTFEETTLVRDTEAHPIWRHTIDGGITLELNTDRNCYVRLIKTASKDLHLPAKYLTYNIIGITNHAFTDGDSSSIENIYISDQFLKGFTQSLNYCANLKNVYVDDNNVNIKDVNGVVFSKDSTELLCYPNSKEGNSYVVPNTVEKVGASAFNNNKYLKEVTISDQVQEIGTSAFMGALSLETLHISSSVQYIRGDVFKGVTTLKNVDVDPLNTHYSSYDGKNVIVDISSSLKKNLILFISTSIMPNDIALIQHNSFNLPSNSGLVIRVPDSVTEIDSGAFNGVGDLVTIILPSTIMTMAERIHIGSSYSSTTNHSPFNSNCKATVYCCNESKPVDWDDKWSGKTMCYWYSETYRDGAWHFVEDNPVLW